MKLKKVEIQAFRAYDKLIDGTFNFTGNDGEPYDFIALFAPNGFGKTSFYDAVEWGITNNIHRFLMKDKRNLENSKFQKSINNGDAPSILRNINSSSTIETIVRVYTDKPEPDDIIENKLKKGRKGTQDTDFSAKSTNPRDYFQKVILSQEWIDAFLKEDDAHQRYEKFMAYFSEDSIDQYYRLVLDLITENNSQIQELTGKLTGVQQALDFDGDQLLISKVNDIILRLKKDFPLEPVSENFSKVEDLSLTESILKRQGELTDEVEKLTQLIIDLESIYNELDDRISLDSYFANREQILIVKKSIEELTAAQKKFKRIREIVNELNIANAEKSNAEKKVTDIKDAQRMLPDFFKREAAIRAYLAEIQADNIVLEQRSDGRLPLDLEVNTKKSEWDRSIESLDKLREGLENFKKAAIQNAENYKEIDKMSPQLSGAVTRIKESSDVNSGLEERQKILTDALTNIKLDLFPASEDANFLQYKEELAKVESLLGAFSVSNERVSELKKAIDAQKMLSENIEKFIATGSEIATQKGESTCPLCTHDHGTFEDLLRHIQGNNALSAVLKTLMAQLSSVEETLALERRDFSQLKENLLSAIEKELEELMAKIVDNRKVAASAEQKLQELKDEMLSLESLKNDFKLLLQGESEENRLKALSDELLAAERITPALKSVYENALKALEDFDTATKILRGSVQVKVKAAEDMEKEEAYKKMLDYISLEFGKKSIVQTELDKKNDDYAALLSAEEVKVKNLDDELKELQTALAAYKEEEVDLKLAKDNNSLKELQSIVTSFEQWVIRKFDAEIQLLEKENFIVLNNELLEKNDKLLQEKQSIVRDYTLLMDMKAHIEPLLTYNRAKKDENDLKKEITFLSGRVQNELVKEKAKIAAYIEEQIKSFFYEDLINELYRRIDPHPDYKRIKFVCDFNDDKPKLNVCVYKENEDLLTIPNLYFSTAQLNILSLSIFLAKALNAVDNEKKYLDCIFIDDPIQSMDSINVLSTIDLLRSLVVNEKKQIILSTHDENFHSLLKKKMPEALYRSKFMELETFGKLKRT